MSLYNALFGENVLSSFLLDVLGTNRAVIPRYRDCFLSEDASEIVIHTRTGGGNRDFYESEEACRRNYPEDFAGPGEVPSGPWNDDIRNIPGYLRDEDADYDCTYANFYFTIPEAFKPVIDALRDAGKTPLPAEKWKNLMADLQSGNDASPEAKRAREVGKRVADALKDDTGGIVEI